MFLIIFLGGGIKAGIDYILRRRKSTHEKPIDKKGD